MIPNYSLNDVLAIKQQRIPLPEPTGVVVRVGTVDDIINAIEDAEDGSTIIIAKGHYKMHRDCILTSHRVTIRGETGNREDVILDSEMEFDDTTRKFCTRNGAPAIIKISHARDVTIADLTLANNPKYGILFFGDGNVQRLKIYNVKFHNIWARGLKGTSATSYDDRGYPEEVRPIIGQTLEHFRPRNGEVRNCLFVLDHPKRNDKDGFNGDYIAGLDLMHVKDWVIADNVFVGIQGMHHEGRGSVFIWNESESVTVENNIFFDCDRGVCLGNPSGKANKRFHIYNATVKNNIFLGGVDFAIEIDFGDQVVISGNKIASMVRTAFPAIQVVDIATSAVIENNEMMKCSVPLYKADDKVQVRNNTIL